MKLKRIIALAAAAAMAVPGSLRIQWRKCTGQRRGRRRRRERYSDHGDERGFPAL